MTTKQKGHRHCIAILFMTIIIFSPIALIFSPHRVYKPTSSEPLQKGTIHSQTKKLNIKIASTQKNKTLDLISLRDYITNELLTENGGFPLHKSGDEYINSTYFGILALYALGGLQSDVLKKIKTFMDYMYDETAYAFREWIGGNASLMGTLWGLIITNFTGIKPKDFDLNKTLAFVKSKINETNELNLTVASLLLDIENIFNASLLSNSTSVDTQILLSTILTSFRHGFFYESTGKVNLIFTTHLALDALYRVEPNKINSTTAESITRSILSLIHMGNKNDTLNGGIGTNPDNPSTFETGLATDIIVKLKPKIENQTLISTLNNKSFWINITTFVNNTQLANGAITRNPKEQHSIDIFQAYGAILTYISTDRLSKLIKPTIIVLPSRQIPVDYNKTVPNITIGLRLLGNTLYNMTGYAEINNTLTNQTFLLDIKPRGKIYNINLIENITKRFGNYYTKIFMHRYVGLNPIQINVSTYFRVGYNISILISRIYLHPGQNTSVYINVTYYNKTFAKNGELSIVVYKKNVTSPLIQEKENINGSEINITLQIPSSIGLGLYKVLFIVNDTHGYNHTYMEKSLTIDDVIRYQSILENRSKYFLGEPVSFIIENLTYNHTQHPISTDADFTIRAVYPNEKVYFNESTSPKSGGTVNITTNFSIPTIIPDNNNITFQLVIKWDNTSTGTKVLPLFNATIDIQKLSIESIMIKNGNTTTDINATTVYLGFQYNISINITNIYLSNTTNKTYVNPLINASTRLILTYRNRSYINTQLTYDNKTKLYHTKLYVNPNLPNGTKNITISIFVNYNETWLNITKTINISGTLKVIDWRWMTRNITKLEAEFGLICLETNHSLSNVSLISNITEIASNKTITSAIAYTKGAYLFSVEGYFTDEIQISIIRSSDNTTIATIAISLKAPSKPFRIDIWTLLILVPILAYIAYFVVHTYTSRKISRRFLIERSKRI